jgi:CIC family chloride channel protein
MKTAKHTTSSGNRFLRYPLFGAFTELAREDIKSVYARDMRKWLLIAPVVGIVTGLTITGIAIVILRELWPLVFNIYLSHPWTMIPGLLVGCAIAGLIMQYLTPDPNEHSTEEIIRAYHERQGDVNMRAFLPKMMAAVATIGFGGSSALEGPCIYAGGAIGSWLWTRLRRLRLEPRDRRILLICGAAAGMSAVFRAPLTGIVFALEMPYKDDLAHEALLPSLIASVVSYMTLSSFLGHAPLFDFATEASFNRRDLLWCALLGLVIGLISMVFVTVFRHVRTFCVHSSVPHWIKLSIGGLFTAFCGLIFLYFYNGPLVPVGPNYEAVGLLLSHPHSSFELVVFAVLKLAATLFTVGAGGVSAMFVPLFLCGEAFGLAFAQSIVHSAAPGLYAAVGMACFISAGYKTPLAAVVFVAEATEGHAFIVPSLIGAAVAYAVSGDASASGDQRLHEIRQDVYVLENPGPENHAKYVAKQVAKVIRRVPPILEPILELIMAEISHFMRRRSAPMGAYYIHGSYVWKLPSPWVFCFLCRQFKIASVYRFSRRCAQPEGAVISGAVIPGVDVRIFLSCTADSHAQVEDIDTATGLKQ